MASEHNCIEPTGLDAIFALYLVYLRRRNGQYMNLYEKWERTHRHW